jgi:two-component system phosphate regulon sensor histidine kinase PhoR
MTQLPVIKAVIEAMPAPVIVLDPEGRIESVNAPALVLFGEWGAGRSCFALIRQPEPLAMIEAALAQGCGGTAPYSHAEGEVRTEYTMRATPLGQAGAGRVLLHFADTSALSATQMLLRGFVANVSHELKTPLTALSGFIETLQGPARDDPDARTRFLAMMAREADRMNRLVADLLSLSRVEAQERARPVHEVDLVAVVLQALDPLRGLAADAGVTLAADLPERAMATGDADQLTQVVTNLTENALKYGGALIRITLVHLPHDAQIRGPAWQLCVQDTGTGIDAVHLPHLTERFYRVDSHRARGQAGERSGGGTGLGLAIVKHIASRHRGHLRISSLRHPAAGHGSRFCVVLPAPPTVS